MACQDECLRKVVICQIKLSFIENVFFTIGFDLSERECDSSQKSGEMALDPAQSRNSERSKTWGKCWPASTSTTCLNFTNVHVFSQCSKKLDRFKMKTRKRTSFLGPGGITVCEIFRWDFPSNGSARAGAFTTRGQRPEEWVASTGRHTTTGLNFAYHFHIGVVNYFRPRVKLKSEMLIL